MKPVSEGYATEDGRYFKSREEAEQHELVQGLEAEIRNHYQPLNWLAARPPAWTTVFSYITERYTLTKKEQ